jgi:hypothetical protein
MSHTKDVDPPSGGLRQVIATYLVAYGVGALGAAIVGKLGG